LPGRTRWSSARPVANRPRAELEPLIGFFVNTLALRTCRDRTTPRPSRAARSRPPHDARRLRPPGRAFEQVVEALQPVRTLAHSPVFQAMFSLNNTPRPTLALPGSRSNPGLASTTTQFD
jgi:non-ribosomal peptide synthetase component F